MVIETKDLILDKAKISDWKGMYHNVWKHQESAKHMAWSVLTNEKDALIRLQKTIAFQMEHDTYLVYDKKSGEPIGFAGVEQLEPTVWQEAGICLGPDYMHKGLGKQILSALIRYCREMHGAKTFFYSTRDENTVSVNLAKSLGFEYVDAESRTDRKDGHSYQLLRFQLKL